MKDSEPSPRGRWAQAWPDALAFVFGLGLAWCFAWETRDLVWSLWLSSLVVGYATLVWTITGPLREIAVGLSREARPVPAGPASATMTAIGIGTLFMIGFFTVHFGGFHFVHAAFLNTFFPVDASKSQGFPGWGTFLEVLRRYWWFLPAAALAERAAFRPKAKPIDVGAITPEAVKARLGGETMMAPYRNVIRMHLLIFFFAFAHFTRLSNFVVYAVAYAAYFFPWRLMRRQPPA